MSLGSGRGGCIMYGPYSSTCQNLIENHSCFFVLFFKHLYPCVSASRGLQSFSVFKTAMDDVYRL